MILAKQDGSFSSSSTPTPGVDAAYTINFQTFLTAAEELLRKRISIHSKLQHIECQLSVNHMLSFVFQIVERLLEESMIKATALQKVRLGVLVNTLRDNYQVALQVGELYVLCLVVVLLVVVAVLQLWPPIAACIALAVI